MGGLHQAQGAHVQYRPVRAHDTQKMKKCYSSVTVSHGLAGLTCRASS